MPASISQSTYNWAESVSDPRALEEGIFRQTFSSSPMLATMLGMQAYYSGKGMKVDFVKFGSSAYIKAKLQTGTTANGGNIAPSASVSTSIDITAVEKPLKTVFGDYTCYYEYMPCDLDMWLRGGEDAINPLRDVFSNIMDLSMTQRIVDGVLSAGASNDMDGLQKWCSASANKWGVDTSQAANAYFRGTTPTALDLDDFSADMLRDIITTAELGSQGSGSMKYSTKYPSLGIVDYGIWKLLQKLVYDKQAIYLPDGKGFAYLGGFFKPGIVFNNVTFFPDAGLDRLKDTNASTGEMFVLCPETFKIYMHKDFAFKIIADPGEYIGKEGVKKEWIDMPTVLWGKYVKLLAVINMFCSRCRNNLYQQFN